jgi:quercetin dioxygenase-like cupin family protein
MVNEPAGATQQDRTVKGQFFHTWKDTTDWVEVPEFKLRYKPIPFGAEGQETTALMVRYDPGSEVPVHHHPSDYCSLVVDGSIEITRKVHEVGSVRIVKAGTAYGPLKVGESGCTVIDVFAAGPQGVTYLGREAQ